MTLLFGNIWTINFRQIKTSFLLFKQNIYHYINKIWIYNINNRKCEKIPKNIFVEKQQNIKWQSIKWQGHNMDVQKINNPSVGFYLLFHWCKKIWLSEHYRNSVMQQINKTRQINKSMRHITNVMEKSRNKRGTVTLSYTDHKY